MMRKEATKMKADIHLSAARSAKGGRPKTSSNPGASHAVTAAASVSPVANFQLRSARLWIAAWRPKLKALTPCFRSTLRTRRADTAIMARRAVKGSHEGGIGDLSKSNATASTFSSG